MCLGHIGKIFSTLRSMAQNLGAVHQSRLPPLRRYFPLVIIAVLKGFNQEQVPH